MDQMRRLPDIARKSKTIKSKLDSRLGMPVTGSTDLAFPRSPQIEMSLMNDNYNFLAGEVIVVDQSTHEEALIA